MDWTAFGNFIKDQMPMLLAIVYAYMNSKVVRAENKVRVLELESKIKDVHAKIDSQFSGMSSADVVTKFASGDNTNSDPN